MTAFDIDGIEYPAITTTIRTAVQSRGQSGFSRGRQVYERPMRTVNLSWSNATEALVFQIASLWNETLGGVLPMTWNPIDGSTAFEVRFAQRPEIAFVRTARGHFQVSLTFEEVL